ncbi:unnamed protein product [Clavelina lepadiformis]|uniref:Uncharacterized protein n=1 Tax=Clavelina lepadiformis TaxID=159417 RepID=A0ABP0F9S9_CLALP
MRFQPLTKRNNTILPVTLKDDCSLSNTVRATPDCHNVETSLLFLLQSEMASKVYYVWGYISMLRISRRIIADETD